MGLFDNILNAAADAVSKEVTPVDKQVKTVEFTFSALPESLDQLKALPEADMSTPYKTAALTVCALCAYAANKQIGMDMLNFLKGPQPLSTYEIQFLDGRYRDIGTYVPFSYFEGASVENNYAPTTPFKIKVSSNPYSFTNEGYAVLYITSAGADSPREIKLRRKGDGQWCLWEQMLLVGIRTPKANDPWA